MMCKRSHKLGNGRRGNSPGGRSIVKKESACQAARKEGVTELSIPVRAKKRKLCLSLLNFTRALRQGRAVPTGREKRGS